MDFTAINFQEAILSLRGLVLQAGILDNISVFLRLVLVFVMVGAVVTVFRVGVGEKTLVNVIIYLLAVSCLWGLLRVRSDVNLNLFLPPEQKKVAEKSKEKASGTMRVSLVFAYTVGLINQFERVAISLIGKALSPDKVARNSAGIIESVAFAMTTTPSDVAAVAKDSFKELQGKIEEFLKTERYGCRWILSRAAATGDTDTIREIKKKNLRPWIGALERAVVPDAGALKEDYEKYEKLLKDYRSRVVGRDEKLAKKIKYCLSYPAEIQESLYGNFFKYLNEKERAETERDKALLTMGLAFGGGDDSLDNSALNAVGRGVFYGFAKKTMIRALVLVRGYPKSALLGQIVARSKEAFGIPGGVKKMLEVIRFMPYVRGLARTVLYAIFPFFMIMAFLPAGLRWLGTYYKFIFAVSLWSVLDVIIVGLSDEIFWNSLVKAVAGVHGIDFSLSAMVWAQGVAMVASPVTAYSLVQLAGSGAFGAGAGSVGPSLGVVGKIARTAVYLVR